MRRLEFHFRLLSTALALESDRQPEHIANAIERVYEGIQQMFPYTAERMHPYEVERLSEDAWGFAARMSARNLGVQRQAILDHGLELRQLFRDDLQRRWGSAIGELRLLHEVAWEASRSFHDVGKREGNLYAVLVRLSARGLAVCDEAICLLENGFASGAMARWRTLHEVSVIATVISQGGEEVATRYLAHEIVARATHVRSFQQRAHALGLEPLKDDVVGSILNARDEAVARYGKAFRHPYGWANGPDVDRRLTLPDLESLAGMSELRPFYYLANQPVHGGAHGLLWEIGAVEDQLLLTGPSDQGFVDPGQLLAFSMVTLTRTFALASAGEDLRWRIYIDVLETLSERVAGTFAMCARDSSGTPGTAGQVLSAADLHAPSMLEWPALKPGDFEIAFARALRNAKRRSNRADRRRRSWGRRGRAGQP